MSGIVLSDSGKVFWEDKQIVPKEISWKRQIGYLSEHNPLYTEMYVEQFLRFICQIYKIDSIESRINKVIAKVGLDEYRKSKIEHLSKGYRQRVGIAQSIIHDPKILILDEPTSGLDPNQLIEIRSLIKSLSSDRIIILSSHILREVDEICSRVLILKNGSIATDRLQDTEKNRGISLKVSFDAEFNPEWFRSIGKIKMKTNNDMHIVLDSNEKRPELFDIAVSKSLRILEMSSDRSDLESEFVALTKEE